ncbi:death domain-containing protein CRADD isoform X2 [Pristis pectinata]|uniref:death domain-containing protein CRADD isoform X2 n=1 Tax=Pristis pectinata TaxID=685728 RepID=UPI00223D58D8|nr:death domain-containing protein CRADD isoform X2 [Pristis pectinata]
MEAKQRRVLRRLRLELAEQLRVEQPVQYLYQERVVSQSFLEELEAEPVGARRTLKLLDYLPGRGPRAFAAFAESLRDEFPWLCRRLEEEERAEEEPEPPAGTLLTSSSAAFLEISTRLASLQRPRGMDWIIAQGWI